MAAVQSEPWLRALITTTTTTAEKRKIQRQYRNAFA
jgi:hypothetical protein